MVDETSRDENSSVDEWLLKEGLTQQSTAAVVKQSLAAQIRTALEEEGVTKAELARRMNTSRPAVDRLLDPTNQSITLATLEKAARALNRELQLELLRNWLRDSDATEATSEIPLLIAQPAAGASRPKRSKVERLVGTVFFEVTADQIAALDERGTVELLRRLVAADLNDAGIALRGSTVSAQIHVPDGGEDGRVQWSGGSNDTLYLPSRFCIFQAKSGDPGTADLRSEVRTEKADAGVELKPAMRELLEASGSYVVVISAPLTGQKIRNRKLAIRRGIEDAGGEPDNLAAVEIYDANALSDWVNIHPSVALWVNEQQRKVHLSGFQTYSGWGLDEQIAGHRFLDEGHKRFLVRGSLSASEKVDRTVTSAELRKEVVAFLTTPRKSLRIIGASGLGKSRLAFELFSLEHEDRDKLDGRSVVFAQYEDIKDRLGAIALDLANSGASTILVIDDCPEEAHRAVLAKAKRDGSLLRIVTTDVSLTCRSTQDCLVIELLPAPKELIGKIVEQAASDLSQIDMDFVADLADGFPRMAVLGARAVNEGYSALSTVDDLVQRILWGQSEPNADALHLIEMLSLFALVGVDREAAGELESIAIASGVDVRIFRNHLRHFEQRGILLRKGDYREIQLLPLAIRLGSERIETLGQSGLLDLYKQVTPRLQLRLLRQLKWFDQLDIAQEFGRTLLSAELVDDRSLDSESGSRLLDRIMHVDPDFAMETIHRLLGAKTIGELQRFSVGRRNVVVALQRLVFRKESFYQAATLLRRLGAAETENWSNNAAGVFEGLYKLYLSGTEAGLEERVAVLDEGLRSEHESERSLCVRALGNMLDRHHFSRSGGYEQIGSGPPMQDWRPKTGKDVLDFHLAALSRLSKLACQRDSIGDAARARIAAGIRGLLSVANFFAPVRETILKVASAYGFWPKAIMAVSNWLYFDRKGVPGEYAVKVRGLYDELVEELEISDQVILYTKGWQTDLHDPDSMASDDEERDWRYAERKAISLAEHVAKDAKVLATLLPRVTQQRLHGVFPFAKRLAECSGDPVDLVKLAREVVSDKPPQDIELRFFAGLVAGTDSKSHADAIRAIEVLLSREDLAGGLISIIGGAKIDEYLLGIAADLIRRGLVPPATAATLAYGRGLDHLDAETITSFLDSLVASSSEGVWAALDAVCMYQHGRDSLSRPIVNVLKRIVISANLFEGKPRTALGTHELGQAVKLLIRYGHVDSRFARSLAEQMVGLAEVDEYEVQLELEDAAQKILELLIADHPREVWNAIKGRLEAEDPLFAHRISGLLGIDKSADDGAALLHALPAEIYFEWMEEKPNERVSVVLGWLPITIKSSDGSLQWHPDLVQFVERYVNAPEDLDIVAQRLFPSSWWGSLADRLEPSRRLVATWCDHPMPAVRQWALRTESRLRATILNERRQDANEETRFFE